MTDFEAGSSEQRVFDALQPIVEELGYQAEIGEPMGNYGRRPILVTNPDAPEANPYQAIEATPSYVWLGASVEALAEWLAHEIKRIKP